MNDKTPTQPTRYEHADMPVDDDPHGFINGEFVPVSFVGGRLVQRVEGPEDPRPVKTPLF